MQKFRKLILLAVMCMALLLVAACQSVAVTPNEENFETFGSLDFQKIDATIDALGFEGSSAKFNTINDDDLVDVIIEVEGDSLVDKYFAQNISSELKDYVLTDDAAMAIAQMQEDQAGVKANLTANGIASEFKHEYTSILNGFSATVRYGDVAKIEKLASVKRVIVSEIYAMPTVAEGMNSTAAERVASLMQDTGIMANHTGYDGSGIVIAVIDTGVDYKHAAFSINPEVQALTKEEVNAVMSALNGKGNISQSYYSGKMPFQYDYADKNVDVMPTSYSVAAFSGYHGTHVAGIALGNDPAGFIGAAPNAQLVGMKVFKDNQNSGAATADIVAGLADCAVLGVDVINMSLGSPAGFSQDADEYVNSVYSLLERLGISVMVSAGNSYSTSIINRYGAANAAHPDIGVVGSPSSFDTSFSVASVNSYVKNFFTVGSSVYQYVFNFARTASGENHPFYNLFLEEGQTTASFELAYIPGFGTPADYAGLDVKGKAVLVQRGNTSFTEKVAVAAEAGAAMCILYNNESASAFGAVVEDLKIPTISITLDDANLLINQIAGGKTEVTFNTNNSVVEMSEFSSWGLLPNLELKPDLTAAGGNIWSSMPTSHSQSKPDGYYAYLSGTSMAAPNLAGVVASVRQYLRETMPSLTNREARTLAYQLLQSTAVPAIDLNGVRVSPRSQGAGIADIASAVSTRAYLTVTGSERTKLSLGDDPNRDGVYTLRFNLVNFDDKALSYAVDAYAMTETVKGQLIQMTGDLFEEMTVEVYANNVLVEDGIVTAEAGETVALKVVIRLSDAEKEHMDKTFKNGYYVEGWADLKALDSEVDLSIPFVAFYGNWMDARLFDGTGFDGDEYYVYPVTLVGAYNSESLYMGTYQYAYNEGMARPAPDKNKIAISNVEGANNYIAGVFMSAMRNLADLSYTFKDAETGYVYARYIGSQVRKTYWNNGQIVYGAHGLGFYTADYDFANNQQILIEIEGTFEYQGRTRTEVITLPIMIDSEAPTLLGVEKYEENGAEYIDINAFDNNMFNSYNLYTYEGESIVSLYEYQQPIFSNKINENQTFKVNLTNIKDKINENGDLIIYLEDSAFNRAIYLVNVNDGTIKGQFDGTGYFENTVNGINDAPASNATITTVVENGADTMAPITTATADEHEFSIVNGLLTAYAGPGGEIVIPEGVKEIGPDVFRSNYTITKVVIPEGCTKIGTYAFAFCSYMKELVLPSTLTTLSTMSFRNLRRLEKVNLMDTQITNYGTYAFSGCQYLKSLEVPAVEGQTITLGTGFANSCDIESIVIHGNVGNISSAFNGNNKLKSLIFEGNVGNITGQACFAGLYNCEVLEFHGNVGNIGTNGTSYHMFGEMKIKTLEFHGDIGNLQGFVFGGCSELEEVIFHGSVGAYTHHYAFAKTPKLTHFTVAEGNDKMLYDEETKVMYNLTKTIMYTPSSWGYDGVFELPETITTLVEAHFTHTFYYDKTTITYDFADDGVFTTNFFLTSYGHTEELNVLKGVKLHSKITSLPRAAFRNQTAMETLEGHESVKTMTNTYIFAGCKSLKNVDLSNVTSNFGNYMFQNCTGLETFEFPNKNSVSSYMFQGCTSLREVTFTGKNTYGISSYAFDGCSSLVEINVPTVTTISSYAFRNCTSLESVTVSKSVAPVGASAFEGCTSLKSFTIGTNGGTLGASAFKDCTSLESIDLGTKITAIPDYAFQNCVSLKSIEIPATVKTIGVSAFENTGLEVINLPASIVSFDTATSFAACANLREFNAPENSTTVKSIDGVLYNKAMTEIMIYPAAKEGTTFELPETVTTIGSYAFYLNKNVETLYAENVELIKNAAFLKSNIIEVVAQPIVVEAQAFMDTPIEVIDLSKAEEFGVEAFRNTPNLLSVDLSSVIAVENYAFYTSALKELTLTAGIEWIGSRAFANNPLETLYIGGLAYFDYAYVFYGCDIKNIEILDDCTAFKMENDMLMTADGKIVLDYVGEGVKNLVIPEGVTKVAAYAFENEDGIETIEFASTVKYIGDRAFFGIETLRELTFKSEKAPRLEGMYNANARYCYANFVCDMLDVEANGVEIVINHPATGNYDNYIYNRYFKHAH